VNSEQPLISAAAFILMGGKSSRMGQPKAMLRFDGEPLIGHLVRKLALLFSQIVVVTAPGQEIPSLGVKFVRDEVPYQGPVGGIFYGLKASGHPICFVTSCDAPFLKLPLISHLLSQISEYDVVVPVWEDRLQPLHAVYRSSVAPALKEQLERNEMRPIFLYDKVRTRKVSAEEVRRFDPDGLSFLNMNTPEDYQTALRFWHQMNEGEKSDAGAQSIKSISVPASNSSMTCTVELFGVARLLAKIPKITLTLPQDATAADLFSAMAAKLPVLVGKVIKPDAKGLISGHACNLNGRDFMRDASFKIHAGDCVFIISADAGG
jgi:molybdopterin-guanine dinucleotide biosynthesis protein A